MSVMASRRVFGAGFLGAVAALVSHRASAQFTEQEVRQGADVVATGDVDINQTATASQDATFGVWVDGELVTQDGIYQSDSGQVVVQNGRVVATGDVSVNQVATASQTTTTRIFPESDGEPARVCDPGAVIANPYTGQVYYQRHDCCWYRACASGCDEDPCDKPGAVCEVRGSS